MNFVPLDSVVEEAMLVIGGDQDNELLKTMARQWIWRFKQELPVTEDEIKVCTIYPKNLILKKPSDMRRHLELSFYDSEGNWIPSQYHAGKDRIFPDFRFWPPTATNITNSSDSNQLIHFVPVDYSQDQFAFYLGTNGDNVSYAKVRYYAYPLDKDGMPLIREDEVQGCIYYVRFCASLRKDENQSAINENERRYKMESDRLRAKMKAATLNNDEARQIAKIRNRMVPRYNSRTF